MDALKGNIFEILNGNKHFQIPVYQRYYSWEQEHCKRLWNDLVEMHQRHRDAHFIGPIVNIAEQVMPTGVQKFMIIDGQQRITTLMLLLIALRDYALDHPDDKSINHRRIDNMLLKNEYEEGPEHYKLLLTEQDNKIFTGLVERLPVDSGWKTSRIYKNYKVFVEYVQSKALTPAEIYQSIGQLQIVNITLDRTVDDAQAIFESLNSTGKELSQSDLIRNYVLMGLAPEEQNDIYLHLWKPMENLFSLEKRDEYMDKFFRNFLTMKIGRIPKFDVVYDEFKMYRIKQENLSIRELCQDLLNHSKYYTDILYNRTSNATLKKLYTDINELSIDVVFPFLLAIHDDHAHEIINKEELAECIRLCLSYVVRRSICNMPTNALNKTFATLRNEIYITDYVNSLKVCLISLHTLKRFPGDDEFASEFVKRDIYNMRNRNFILSRLENFDNKAAINIENYTIEHIMPQNSHLSKEWQDMLGTNWKGIQEKYLHTIGNLTLTAYNEKMSDNPFLKKRDMEGGFRESALRLNGYVVKQDRWDEKRIRERASLLSEKAKQIWSYPEVSSDIISLYTPQKSGKYSLNSYNLSKKIMLLYENLDKRIMNISSYVRKEFTKHYIAYKYDSNFTDIKFQKNNIKIYLNIKFSKLEDPKSLCRDITDIGSTGNGNALILYSDIEQLDYIMFLISQCFHEQEKDI